MKGVCVAGGGGGGGGHMHMAYTKLSINVGQVGPN